ncbi:DNA-3-methyladenine glycosylase [Aerococcaceae bacterium DSM 111176]|nr:DNA-3-methyladenine glycosylase [Aerococcaceae bacterium DSM 111176]
MFYQDFTKTTDEIARELLGYRLVHETAEGVASGWIVEVEAYLGAEDKGAHTYNGHRTPRVEAMYMDAGHFYIYQIRGHHSINFVTQPAGVGQGVLIRALEPDDGIDLMHARRGGQTGYNLTNGPGKLCQALAIDKTHYGTPATQCPLYIDFSRKRKAHTIETSPRIGLSTKAQEWQQAPLRFTVQGNPWTSHFKGKPAENNGWLSQ